MQAIKMPKKGSVVKFKNYHKQLLVPFVIYADFEAFTQKIDRPSCQPTAKKPYSVKYQQHLTYSYKYKIVCCYDDKFSKPIQIYRGKNATYKFLEAMLEEVKYCNQTFKIHFNKPMIFTSENDQKFRSATKCHICGCGFIEGDSTVRDRDHFFQFFRGAAHKKCNLLYRLTDKICVIFHNLRGYNSHLIMQQIGKFEKSIDVISNNMEKYMAFFLGNQLKFIDSYQFEHFSLESLAKNLLLSDMKYTAQEFLNKKLDLMKKKGLYPYDYMDNFEKFNDKNLPPKKEFF